ncbi:MAG: YgjV family protein [Oscillospiraceae bacterium]|jgi:hypothetical protein|nr:YgjV family protein [Oscillospiraceae bacterium]
MESTISQIIGVFAIIAFAAAPHMKKKSILLLFLIIGNFLTVIEFLLLGSMTEVAVISVSTVRTVTFFFFSKYDKRAPIWVLIAFLAMQGGAVYFTWKSWVSLLMLFDMVQTYGQWQTNMKILRICTIIGSIPIGIYNIIVGGYTGAVNQFLQSISAAIALWNIHYRPHKNMQ